MNATFYAVGVWVESLGRMVTCTVFAEDAAEARSRVEIEGFKGHGLLDGERIEWVSALNYDDPSQSDALADAFNAGHTLGMADARLEDAPATDEQIERSFDAYR